LADCSARINTRIENFAARIMSSELELFEQIAQRRHTVKVISETEFPTSNDRDLVNRLIACAGWAPFHKMCSADHRSADHLAGIEPWRFHSMDSGQCRALRRLVIDDPAAGKIPGMLATARATILATWLPNPSVVPPGDSEAFEPTVANVEHIAAASAAVQSLLLAATAAGVRNYWSSGGVLRSPAVFNRLGIPSSQRLLGAIFLFPEELPESSSAEIAKSKLRAERCSPLAWSRWVEL
jgi:nitroreductase